MDGAWLLAAVPLLPVVAAFASESGGPPPGRCDPFGPEGGWAPVDGNPRAAGVLPPGWTDRSEPLGSECAFSREEEDGVIFLRIRARGEGKAQIARDAGTATGGVSAFRVRFRARTRARAGLLFGLRAADRWAHSDWFYAAGLVEIGREWKEYDVPIRGELPAGPAALCLNFGAPGALDLASIALDPMDAAAYTPPTTAPVEREPNAVAHHRNADALAKETQPRIVLLGDSITDGWDGEDGRAVWSESVAPLGAANLGIGANRIEHVLWQVDHSGLGAGYRPPVVAVLIGINNLFRIHSLVDIEDGMKALLARLRARSPDSVILLQGILPSGKERAPRRDEIAELNRRFARLADGRRVVFLDWGGDLLLPDGRMKPEVSRDGTHLTGEGYRLWAAALVPKAKGLLERPPAGAAAAK